MLSKIKIVHIDKTSSTQDAVVEYLKNDYFPSVLLIAKIQTKGRGRKDDDWLLLSMYLDLLPFQSKDSFFEG